MEPKVKINLATEDELCKLPHIDVARARKIIAERTSNGPFSRPDDLTRRVTGFGKDLPNMLSTYIDWIIPVPPESPKARQWLRIMLWVALFLLLPAVIYPTYAALLRTIDEARLLLSRSAYTALLIGSLVGPILLVFIEAFLVTIIVSEFTHNRHKDRRWTRYGYMIAVGGAIVSLILFAALAVLIPLQTPVSFTLLPRAMYVLIAAPTLLLLIYGLPLYSRDRPGLASNRLFRTIYGTAMVVGPVAVITSLHLMLASVTLPLAFYVLEIVLGITVVHRSYVMIRDSSWYFSQAVASLAPSVDPEEERRRQALLEFINRQVPNPSDQQALVKAMMSKYPSTQRAPFSWATLTTGLGWISITKGVEAVYELIVQNRAEHYWKTMKEFFGW